MKAIGVQCGRQGNVKGVTVEGYPYQLELPFELEGIHDVFHVSNLKKCLVDESMIIPYREAKINKQLQFVEGPVEIMDMQVKKLRRSKIPIVKVRWDSKRGPEYTWEKESKMRRKYPQLFETTC
ncbi:hypothetical protein E3N88_15626 [Mikania micrantha]|uniref:Tf2-1-like SH3-like domain-containing protein n=1 Tax=Mikania micrantha TaxID=192012 RepID=A0A5N6NYQ0_9ASTR|nr:hypothetical protein E3N88_15626 [Mikania micrantha]